MRFMLAILGLSFSISPLAAQEISQSEVLTRSDFIREMDAVFSRLDRDGSRVLLPEEIEAVERDAARAEVLRQNRQIFAELDKNANGSLDVQEFAALANLDAIKIDTTPFMTQFDTDRDGTVTLVEYRIVTQGNYDRVDSDRDGVVTPIEMQSANLKL